MQGKPRLYRYLINPYKNGKKLNYLETTLTNENWIYEEILSFKFREYVLLTSSESFAFAVAV
jgi:hypothetical protein